MGAVRMNITLTKDVVNILKKKLKLGQSQHLLQKQFVPTQ